MEIDGVEIGRQKGFVNDPRLDSNLGTSTCTICHSSVQTCFQYATEYCPLYFHHFGTMTGVFVEGYVVPVRKGGSREPIGRCRAKGFYSVWFYHLLDVGRNVLIPSQQGHQCLNVDSGW